MSKLTAWMDRVFYPCHNDNWDDSHFRREILSRLSPEWSVLDLGAGAGIVPQMNFRFRVARLTGIDPDPRVAENPYLDQADIGLGDSLPYSDSIFDLIFADNVLEHLPKPEAVFREVARTLKPGGYFMAKTPNCLHYVPTIARLTSHRFHEWVNMRRGRSRQDSFPTLYRANTPSAIYRCAAAAGLSVEQVTLLEGRPEYLRRWFITYVIGWIYERIVNLVPGLSRFRVVMILTLRKPSLNATQLDERLVA